MLPGVELESHPEAAAQVELEADDKSHFVDNGTLVFTVDDRLCH